MARVPKLTDEQRAAASAKAAENRRKRAAVLGALSAGEMTIEELVQRRGEEALRRIRVRAILRGLPGIGPVRLEHAMRELNIADNRTINGLGSNQRDALIAFYNEHKGGTR